MNRAERRSLSKQGASQETIDKMQAFQSPCTIAEAVQISRGVADDAIADYHRNQLNVQLAMSLQIEILKEIIFSSGMMTEEEFKVKYMQKAKEIQESQAKMVEEQMSSSQDDGITSMKVEAGDVEIKVEE